MSKRIGNQKCEHERCLGKGHCILDALWINPPEFENPDPITAAAVIQERYWKRRHEWKKYEDATALTLWDLVDAGDGIGEDDE